MVEALLHNLIINFSYLGVFLSNIIVNAPILVPLPTQLPIVFAVLLKLNPFLTAGIASAGTMVGEMTGYSLGFVGGKLAKDKLKKYKKLVNTLQKYYKKYAFWVILVTAFLFFPFDLVGIISGLSRYDIRKFLIAGLIGKFLKVLLVFILLQHGIEIFKFITLS